MRYKLHIKSVPKNFKFNVAKMKKIMSQKPSKNKHFTTALVHIQLVLATFFVFCAHFSCFAQDTLPPREETVSNLQKVYEETADFRADFVQETFNKSLKKTFTEEGIVYFKKPRNMRWDYTRPEVKKMIINPQKAWLYVPREKAAYMQKAANIFQSGTLLRFLSGIGKVDDDFHITYALPEAVDKDGNYLLRLTPREKSYSLNTMNMTVDKNTYFITQVSFEDLMGNTTTLKFSNLTRNTGIPDKLFQFSPPAGTNIFDMP